MRAFVLTLFCAVIFTNTYSQKQKIKGNKIVTTEQKSVDEFHTIELYDNFEVTIREDNINHISIEADSNLLDEINIEVIDSVLTIKSDSDIKRSKKLDIKISYAQPLQKIVTYNKVNLKSTSLIETPKLRIESNDDSEVFLSIETDNITSIINGKSNADLDIKANEAFYQINDNAELKGIIDTNEFKIDLYQKGYAKLEGKAENMLLRMDSNTNFYGQKLTSKKASVTTEGSSDCYLLVTEEITIKATNESKIYILGDSPKTIIDTFDNEAIIYRKKANYNPGLF